jgi:ketosteroid isomerase-like protein
MIPPARRSQVSTDRTLRALNLALAERVVKTCGNLRAEEVRDEFAEDAVLALPYAHGGTPREVVGRDAIIDYIGLLGDHFRQGIFFAHTFDTMADDPNEVIARYSANTELLSNGSPYENSYVTLIEVHDGKVVRYTEYFDPINWIVAQGGSVEAPA